RRTDWALCLFFLLTGVNGSFKAFSRSFSSDVDASIRFPCPNQNCGRVFNWKRNLTRHLKYECGLQPRFKCPYCDYYGKLKGNVSKHLLRRHNNRKIYVVDLFQGTA
ncbi:LOLA3 protein, partial [Acromyrmex heyeri]